MPLDLNFQIQLFKEFLNNGGISSINHEDLLKSLISIEFDRNGNVKPETVNSLVRATLNAYTGSQLLGPYISESFLSYYETKLQKSLFFDITTIETYDKFIEIFESYSQKKNILYRGINEAKYRLYSSLQRYWITNKLSAKNIEYKNFVELLIFNASENGEIRKKLDGTVVTDLSILSILQHYLTPTPLLDWTYSLTTSLLFAINGLCQKFGKRRDIENYFSIYHIPEENFRGANLKFILEKGLMGNLPLIRSTIIENYKLTGDDLIRFNESMTDERLIKIAKKSYGPGIQIDLSMIDKLFGFEVLYFGDYEQPQDFNFGLNNNPNILEQMGVFTFNNNPTKPIEHMVNINNVENGIIKSPIQLCYCWDINKNISDRISKFLINNGFEYDALFPEPSNSFMINISKDIFKTTISQLIKI